MPQPQGPKDPLQPPPPGVPAVEKPFQPGDKPADEEDDLDEYTAEDVKNYQKRHGV